MECIAQQIKSLFLAAAFSIETRQNTFLNVFKISTFV